MARQCSYNDDGMRMLAYGLAYAMTEYYAVFRLTVRTKILLWDYVYEHEAHVRYPKHHEDNYGQKLIQFKKECIGLIDRGYYNAKVTPDVEARFRNEIAEYQQSINEVWE